MPTIHTLFKATTVMPLLMISAATLAAPIDVALAQAEKEHQAAMQDHDAGVQKAKGIQPAVLRGGVNRNDVKPAAAVEMPALAKELKCDACHAIDHKLVGPAWRDVANKYKGVKTFTYQGKQYPLIDGLVLKVSKGGVGNWGTVPMPANDPSGAKKAKIRELVKFEQSLAKR